MRLRSKTWLLALTAAALSVPLLSVPAIAATHAPSPAARSAAQLPAKAHLPAPHRVRTRPKGGAAAALAGPLINNGGPVQTAPQVYVVFWDWTSDPSGERPYLENFLSSVGGTPWLQTVDQYGAGSSGDLLAGTWNDPSPIPAEPSSADVQNEAVSAAAHFGVSDNSVNVQIVVATPTGHSTPDFGANGGPDCAWHSTVNGYTFTNLPYQTDAGGSCGEDSVNGSNGTLDGVSIIEGHELAETITDPLINAWIDASGAEIGDKCAWVNLQDITTSNGTFAMQPLWSNNDNGCVFASSTGTTSAQVNYQAYNTGSTSNMPDPNIELVNTGSNPINLSDITIRYWFTEDGSQPLSFACDYAPIGCANVTGTFGTTSLGGQDHYLQLSFSAGAGQLGQPGDNTGIIQTRFWKQDFTNFTQTNDYSFNSGTTLAPNPGITVYDNGKLIYGAEP